VEVRVGLYATCTDEQGLAQLAIPRGTYTLDVRKLGYKADAMKLDVREDLTVCVDVVAISLDEKLDPYPRGWWG
jgi:hypothetical protein